MPGLHAANFEQSLFLRAKTSELIPLLNLFGLLPPPPDRTLVAAAILPPAELSVGLLDAARVFCSLSEALGSVPPPWAG